MMGSRPPLVVLAAGGTGGHVFPAEALAAALGARGYRLALMTDARAAAYGGVLGTIETHHLALARMSGGLAARARAFVSLGGGFLRAKSILRRLAPDAVVGFGGYPSLPAVLAASRLGIPAAIHEQNAVLGRANRLLAPRVDAIAIAFPAVRFLGPDQRAILTGNPVRPGVMAVRDIAYAAPASHQDLRVLVFGGSQGAHILSKVVPAAVARLAPPLRARLAIAQQCRPEDIDAARAAYAAIGVEAELQTFFTDMPARLAAAHLVGARAGASTVAELAVAGRPALLVPYPHATDDHQTANAEAFAQAGGGWVTRDSEFNAMSLADRLSGFLADSAPLARAAAAARAFGRPDAAERLADIVQRLAPPRHNGGTQPLIREAAE
jgi:UDP-N-acetylglucosamine--N-acetylmuramyl-(pentapeptide) pyrophosphoryl-undecaprenol N-acetylglucosamine transferase